MTILKSGAPDRIEVSITTRYFSRRGLAAPMGTASLVVDIREDGTGARGPCMPERILAEGLTRRSCCASILASGPTRSLAYEDAEE
jgi:hypothetical protein